MSVTEMPSIPSSDRSVTPARANADSAWLKYRERQVNAYETSSTLT
jgi:hypothetical protein